jgi:hypothetical protein
VCLHSVLPARRRCNPWRCEHWAIDTAAANIQASVKQSRLAAEIGRTVNPIRLEA